MKKIIRTAISIWRGLSLGNRPYGYRNLPCDCGRPPDYATMSLAEAGCDNTAIPNDDLGI
jgi:hypothetical protein